MRRYGIGVSLLVVAGLTAMLAAQDAEPKRYALFVGINEYDHGQLGQLKFAQADAEVLGARFRKAGYTQVEVLVGKDATKANIESKVDALLEKFAKGDTIVIGLTGHGVHFGTEKDSHFCPRDAKPFPQQTKTLISMGSLFEKLDQAYSGTKILLVDACRNDPDPTRGRTGGIDSQMVPPESVACYFSCSRGERSYENDTLKHGLFTYALLEALDGKANTNKRGEVTWSQLIGHLPERVYDLQKEYIPTSPFPQRPQSPSNITGFPPVLLKLDRTSTPMEKVEGPREPVAGEERSIEIADGVKMVVCYIPKGKATLGSPESEKNRGEDEKEHEYESKGYWLGKYEVTQDQWEAVMGSNPSYFSASGKGAADVKGMETGNHPVEQVSWDDCQKFLSKLNGRVGLRKTLGGRKEAKLPQEDEWEYGYRGGRGNGRAFYWGDELNGDKANHNGRSSPYGTEVYGPGLWRTTPVGTYESKAKHPWGLCDMSGNVSEWCSNLDSSGGTRCTLRGGSWSYTGQYCRGAKRLPSTPMHNIFDFGFRILIPLD